jgi:quinol monooxygenase YgiN
MDSSLDGGVGATLNRSFNPNGGIQMSEIFLVVRVKIKPEHVAEFTELMKMHVAACKKREPGILQFDIGEDVNSPNTFLFLEKYADHTAHEEHQKAPTLATVREKMKTFAESVEPIHTHLWPAIQPAS